MSFTAEKLYALLPAVYRSRDAEQNDRLKAFLAVFAEQVAGLEESAEQLYDDQFIETCAEWVAPYIGDLIGYRTIHGVAPEVASRRREVANTIAYRRRKGTASMLEQLARDVTGWDARVVEFFQLVGWTQWITNHLRQESVYAPNMREWETLERLGTPFETVSHTVDVRRIATRGGKYNIPNIGVFLWRIDDYPLTDSPAVKVDPADPHRFRFSPLGHDQQLYTFPVAEDEITHIAEPINVPDPISRRVLHENLKRYYGPDRSVFISVGTGPGSEVDIGDVIVCNLSDDGPGWAHPPQTQVAIDPVLGRIYFPTTQPGPAETVYVRFRYGFGANLGGGEYERGDTLDRDLEPVQPITAPAAIQPVIDAVVNGGAVEIQDSGRYEESLSIQQDAGRLELRSVNNRRPTIVLSSEMTIEGADETEITLNGLLIAGEALRIPASATNGLRKLTIRHCTLVPGLALGPDGSPLFADSPSLIVEQPGVKVEIEHSILGGIRAVEGTEVSVSDSIVDATSETGIAYADPAVDGGGPAPTVEEAAGGTLSLENVTVIGKVSAKLFEYVSNTIFQARLGQADVWTTPVRSERKQAGCVRFSFLPEGARTPRRYRCQPELAIRQAIAAALDKDPLLDLAAKASIAIGVRDRVHPLFNELRYGTAAYCLLRPSCPEEIGVGADDESEMGAFHGVYAPQREINLKIRLEEYLRFGLEAGIFYVA
jgi:hypothetical protein